MRKKTDKDPGILSQLVKTPSGLIGTIVITLLCFAAVFAPLISPYHYSEQNISQRLSEPSPEHLLGTDHLGRDLLSRIVYGTRIAFQVALPAVLISLVVGVLLGLVSGYFGGLIDHSIIVILDTIQSLPSIVLAMVMLTLLGPSLANLIVVMGVTLFPGYARVVRAQVMSAKQNVYVDAEKSLGAGSLRIITGHILPNVIPAVIILSTMDFPAVITIEAGLSFLGMGVRPPSPSWGVILNEGFNSFRQSPWPIITAGLALAITTFGFTVFGETLRDILDPKLSGKES